jgi:hypothetical protein
MKTYPLRNEGGEVYAFEMPNSSFLSSRSVARYFSRCPGVSVTRVRRLFAFGDEVHIQFSIDGESFEVWEPYGDNSRYWVGPSSEPQRRRACVDRLESFVRETWPGPVSKARDKLISLFRGWHGA